MQLHIRHTTRYRFDEPVSYGLQQLRMTPKSSHQQTVIDWNTEVTGGKLELSFHDHHNNKVDLVSFEKDTQELVVASAGTVEVLESNGIVGKHPGPSPLWLYLQNTALTKPGTECRALLRRVKGEQELERLHNLSNLIGEEVDYIPGTSDADSTAEEAIAAKKGVCQDHSHIFVACAREMGHPARYVSGYLMMDDRIEQDATHAWAEAHLDGIGWVGFDVSNGISPDQRYVRVATGLDYRDAAPVTGRQSGGSGESLTVEVQVAQQ